MNKFTLSMLSAFAISCPLSFAAAQDGGDWTGFYAGASVAAGRFSDGDDQDAAKTSGFGVHAGYLCDTGTFVVGGELGYSAGDYGNTFPEADWESTRLKLIGGYDGGRYLPYALLGVSRYDINQPGSPFSDNVTIFGVGVRYSMTDKLIAGLEYVVQSKDDFDNNFDMESGDLSLRIDYRF